MTMPTAHAAGRTHPSKAIHLGLWVVQILLALMFAPIGALKLTQPIATLAERMIWPGAVPELLVRFIGFCELLGGLGLVLPAATRIKPGLTPLAAAGLASIMALATVFHVIRGELSALLVVLVLFGLAAYVGWGRSRRAPIAPR